MVTIGVGGTVETLRPIRVLGRRMEGKGVDEGVGRGSAGSWRCVGNGELGVDVWRQDGGDNDGMTGA